MLPAWFFAALPWIAFPALLIWLGRERADLGDYARQSRAVMAISRVPLWYAALHPLAGVMMFVPFPRNRKLPAILFDMDGTLLDSIELIVQGAVFAFEGREGARPTRAEWQALIGTPLDTMLARWATGEEDVAFLRGRYRQFQLENHDRLVRLYDGVAATVKELHVAGHPMAIVSSKLDRGIRKSMDHFNLTPLFWSIVGLDATEKHKPHPAPVLFALDELGVRAPDAIFVGDSPHDIQAGAAAGVPTVACTWGAYTRQEIAAAGPDYWIDRITDLPGLIAKLR